MGVKTSVQSVTKQDRLDKYKKLFTISFRVNINKQGKKLKVAGGDMAKNNNAKSSGMKRKGKENNDLSSSVPLLPILF